MKDFGVVKESHQWSRLKQDLSIKPFFVLPFRKFWKHVSAQYGNLRDYSVVLISIRVSLLILADTSYNERGIAEYNRIHTASRPDLEVFKLHDLFTIKHYGPKSVHELNAEGMYGRWLRAISEGSGVSSSAKRRNLAVLRKIMNGAQRQDQGNLSVTAEQCLLCAGSNAAGFVH
jgi:hypothetical protein